MADKLSEPDKKSQLSIGAVIESMLVGIQVALIILALWTVVALAVHTYLIKKSVMTIKQVAGRQVKPVWFYADVDKLREDVALEYLLMTTTSTGMIIVIPDDENGR
ncbi:hypothetical protein GM182_02845 [bacterium 3DAC]|jgi:hypothetical protein|nr:hypothetical protein [Dictyoglomota bacterium]UZN22859.1 hypothetical protein GM182_02845 [bacterium 3DAC]